VLTLLALAAAAPSCDPALDLAVDAALSSPCPTGPLHVLAATAPTDCLAAALGRRGLAPPPRTSFGPAPSPPPDELDTRDAYNLPNVHETEHFAIRWTDTYGFSRDHVTELGEHFEYIWQVEVEELGWPAPLTTDTYKFNIYIGDSGEGSPPSYGYAGYFWYDSVGYPAITLNKDGLTDFDSIAGTAAHEFFHAVENTIDTYDYSGHGAWLFEASAMWIENEVYPDSPGFLGFLYGFALLPELPVDHFLYPDGTGGAEEVHQYGAVSFVRHLSENVADSELIYRWWHEAPKGGDPLVALEPLLSEHDTTVTDVFFDFAGRNATWDYDNSQWYSDALDLVGGFDNSWSHRPTGTVLDADGEWRTPPDHLPATFGANYWRLRALPDHFAVEFEGEPGPEWSLTVADLTWSTGHARWSGRGETQRLEVVRDDKALESWLVIAAAGPRPDDGTRYDYTFRIEALGDEPVIPDLPEKEEPRATCGCTHGSPFGWAPWAVLLLVGLGRARAADQ
jgi:uncharacterized protein (TIGR03382 family)